jgi:uncharacterized protein (TIGR03083 family)
VGEGDVAADGAGGHRWHSEQLRVEARRAAEVAAGLDPAVAVPSCPDWSVAQLVRHLGLGLRWTVAAVAAAPQVDDPLVLGDGGLPTRRSIDARVPADAADLPGWLVEAADEVEAALLVADPDAPMWAWGDDRHVRFWSRRMLHEAVVHRADLDEVAGQAPVIDAEVAVDGIEEVLGNLPAAVGLMGHGWEPDRAGDVLVLAGPDGRAWTIDVGADGFSWRRGQASEPTTLVNGDLGRLELLLYGRRPLDPSAVAIEGDASLLDWWLARTAF